ncbi:FAD-dependent oxidoreductase [Caballeronia sordidicola]
MDMTKNVDTFDLAIVGSGPAGMAAATTAASLGLSVVVLDEQDAPGGQIYRSITQADDAQRARLGPDYAGGARLVAALKHDAIRYEPGAAVWNVSRDRRIDYLRSGESRQLNARRILLCAGAMERPFPVPGWDLPGVMSAGAAQIALKSAHLVPADPVVLAGCGPLLLLLASQYLAAGVPIRAIVDTTSSDDYRRALAHVSSALMGWPFVRKGLAMLRMIRRAGVAHYTGAAQLAIEADEGGDASGTGASAAVSRVARALCFVSHGKAQRIESNLILLHQGVVPNTQFSWALRVPHRWDDGQLCWLPELDAWGEAADLGIFIAGDGARIVGAQASEEQGRLAALAAACGIGRIDAAERDRLAAPVRQALRRLTRIRPFLDALYRPKREHRIPADDVIVCRCEEVTAGQLRSIVALGVQGPNQTKAFSRCGMGPCQGRLCGLTVSEVIADRRGVAVDQVGYYRIRPPIKPVSIGELAGN